MDTVLDFSDTDYGKIVQKWDYPLSVKGGHFYFYPYSGKSFAVVTLEKDRIRILGKQEDKDKIRNLYPERKFKKDFDEYPNVNEFLVDLDRLCVVFNLTEGVEIMPFWIYPKKIAEDVLCVKYDFVERKAELGIVACKNATILLAMLSTRGDRLLEPENTTTEFGGKLAFYLLADDCDINLNNFSINSYIKYNEYFDPRARSKIPQELTKDLKFLVEGRKTKAIEKSNAYLLSTIVRTKSIPYTETVINITVDVDLKNFNLISMQANRGSLKAYLSGKLNENPPVKLEDDPAWKKGEQLRQFLGLEKLTTVYPDSNNITCYLGEK